jgi:hypothetical protein
MPAVTGPVRRRTTFPDESVIVKTTAGASSSSSALNSARLGKATAAPLRVAARSVSCRFAFLVFNSSFK